MGVTTGTEGNKRPGEDAPQADHIRFLFDPSTTLAVLAGHRRRFGSAVETFSAEELAAPSRCEGWTVADVLRHGVWADATMRRVWSGDRAPVSGFDPRTTPHEAVLADRGVPDEEVKRRYLSSTETMVAELEAADAERFGHATLSPAGRVPWWLSAVHLGWDTAIHERDVMTPLDRPVEAKDGEAMVGLAYSLVLASFFDGSDLLDLQVESVRVRNDGGPVTVWAMAPGADDANDHPAVDTALALTGQPAAIVDALSGRASLTGALRGDTAVIERLGGLARYFASGG